MFSVDVSMFVTMEQYGNTVSTIVKAFSIDSSVIMSLKSPGGSTL